MILAGCAALAGALFASCSYLRKGGDAAGRPGERSSPNFRDGKYLNPVPTIVTGDGTVLDTIWRWISSTEQRTPPVRMEFPNPSLRESLDAEDGLRVAWVGHSSVIIKIDGKIFLTDPMWSERASPVSFMGPARFFNPPFPLEALPPLDGVIISHDHYDHLDRDTVTRLAATGVVFYTPLAVGEILRSWGIPGERVVELDWHEERALGGGHSLIAAPARHFSGRGIGKRDTTQWASWIITSGKHRVYFGGDGGYFAGFADIGARYGPFDLVMLEIGAYGDNWPDIHMGPSNAVKAHLDLKGAVLLPIHWGTFNLAFHSWTEPVEKLIAAADTQGIRLCLPRPGLVVGGDLTVNSRWWKADRKSP
ncbi:MAG: MBL fold metallo-hydrolase [Spirochaetes bacterium]|nr:MAG: MBL fold metallo-hydrolase [Spirochaetota bacterium]